ncbi:MAG: hypothetical protein LDL13_09195 [Calditerrivibrio sp.]|nr:hypothetical protein [Calditerrivibrio sp.]
MDITKIIAFIKSPHEHEDGYKEFFILFEKISKRYNIENVMDEYHEFVTSNIIEKTKLLEPAEKFDDKSMIYYLKESIKNFLINTCRANKHMKEVISLNEKRPLSENEEDELIDIIKSDEIESIIRIEAVQILKIVKKSFSEDKQKLLCEILYREKRNEYKFIKDMSENAFYKAVERLKTELQRFFLEIHSSDEAVKYFLYHIYPSEICEKFCLST